MDAPLEATVLLLNISMAHGNGHIGVTTLKFRVLEILQAREEGGVTRTTQAIHSKNIKRYLL